MVVPLPPQAPSFSFGGASGSAFGAAPTPGLAKTASTPLFGTPPTSQPAAAAAPTPSLFGGSSAPAFSFAGPSQPAQGGSIFGAPAGAAAAPASAPAFSFASPFGGAAPASAPAPSATPSLFGGAPAGQHSALAPFSFAPAGGAAPGGAAPAPGAAPHPDDSAVQEIESIKDSYMAAPGNHRYRFQYLFLNVVDNPAARVKPSGVDELAWREALRRAGGPENPDRLWPVLAEGFKGLLARKAAQDEAIGEHSERLAAVRGAVAALAARQEAVLRAQLEGIRRRHTALCQQLLRVLRYVDALEGRFAHAMGHRSATAREGLAALARQLAAVEAGVAPGSTAGLQGKVEALLAAARQRAGAAPGRPLGDLDAGVDPASLHSAYQVLSQYAEALSKMQAVLRRAQREVGVLEDLAGADGDA